MSVVTNALERVGTATRVEKDTYYLTVDAYGFSLGSEIDTYEIRNLIQDDLYSSLPLNGEQIECLDVDAFEGCSNDSSIQISVVFSGVSEDRAQKVADYFRRNTIYLPYDYDVEVRDIDLRVGSWENDEERRAA